MDPLTAIYRNLIQPLNGRAIPADITPHEPRAVYTVEDIERRTRGQADNPEWMACRYGRVTASVCGRIIHASSRAFRGNKAAALATIAEGIVHPKDFTSKATDWGKTNEGAAIQAYIQDAAQFPPGATLDSDCGLYLDPHHPWIGVSPDGIVTLPNSSGTRVLLEVKCPYGQRTDPDFSASGFYLKRGDGTLLATCGGKGNGRDEYLLNMKTAQGRNYYYQIQLSLAVLNIDYAHLFVWTPTKTTSVHIRRQDPVRERQMIKCLKDFYTSSIEARIDKDKFRSVYIEYNSCDNGDNNDERAAGADETSGRTKKAADDDDDNSASFVPVILHDLKPSAKRRRYSH